ncbi:hypothetical protein CQ016_09350 [Arthrobacter sp. MYb222]|nr:hypothetical protein CQ016_09350 [Arthrobacter sp. MYb222]
MKSSDHSVFTSLRTIRSHVLPIDQLISQVVSDRLMLAGYHLQAGDGLLINGNYRTAISRHYYAMYHAARAITFAANKGDDYQRHMDLPAHLPQELIDRQTLSAELTSARLLRNEADYDLYPVNDGDWVSEARSLAGAASKFCEACENFALSEGYV